MLPKRQVQRDALSFCDCDNLIHLQMSSHKTDKRTDATPYVKLGDSKIKKPIEFELNIFTI